MPGIGAYEQGPRLIAHVHAEDLTKYKEEEINSEEYRKQKELNDTYKKQEGENVEATFLRNNKDVFMSLEFTPEIAAFENRLTEVKERFLREKDYFKSIILFITSHGYLQGNVDYLSKDIPLISTTQNVFKFEGREGIPVLVFVAACRLKKEETEEGENGTEQGHYPRDPLPADMAFIMCSPGEETKMSKEGSTLSKKLREAWHNPQNKTCQAVIKSIEDFQMQHSNLSKKFSTY